MEILEVERLAGISGSPATNGLIIPVIYRGLANFPSEIRAKRQYCADFEPFTTAQPRMIDHPESADKLKELASYIADRCSELENAPDMFSGSEKFELPTHEDVVPWVESIQPHRAKFPALAK